MKNVYLKELRLKHYRNFDSFEIRVDNNPIVIIGENGSGKTNVLEAISLNFPGKGLRSASLDDICKSGRDYCCSKAVLQTKLGVAEISTAFYLKDNKRLIEFNGSKIRNSELSRLSNIVWITPGMDHIFLAGASDRRRFFDRIVYGLDSSHAGEVKKYEYYLRERAVMLQRDRAEQNWLTILEEKIAGHAIKIVQNRLNAVKRLQDAIDSYDNDFPKAELYITGVVEDMVLESGGAEPDKVVEFIKNQLAAFRDNDKMSRRNNFGPHRSDFVVTNRVGNMPAGLCSTGQQKALLITVILAQVNSAIRDSITAPILLLDEAFVHLDDRRKDYLIDFFVESGLQSWITATDLSGIEKLAKQAEVVRLG